MGKTSDDFITSNEEYVKLRNGSTDDRPPRETPDSQAPGLRGHSRPDFASWTTEELRQHASDLGIDNTGRLDREALIRTLTQHQARRSDTRR